MNITDLVNRFTFYATDSRDINYDANSKKPSFMVCNVESIQAAVKNGVTFPCMLLQIPQFDKDGDADGPVEHVEASFMILNPVKPGDRRGEMSNYDYCKGIADQIINHMIQDSEEYFEGGILKTAEGDVGPLSDGLYGWGVNFGFDQGYDGQINPARWRTV